MPTYDYKCNDCENTFVCVHGMNSRVSECVLCQSENVEKIISMFAAKTEAGLEGMLRHHQSQAKKDIDRFWKDDKFAANVTGADDAEHGVKLSKALGELKHKNDEARKKLKRVKND